MATDWKFFMSSSENMTVSHKNNSLTIHFPSTVEYINQAEQETRAFLQNSGVAREDVFPICLVMREALLNAVKHGHRFDPEKIVKYLLYWQDDILTMEVEDEGDGFDWRAIQNEPPPVEADHGRGIFIIRRYFSDYQYNDAGNRLVLTKYCSRIKQAERDRLASLEELAQSVLKSPEIIKDLADDDVFRLIENLYVQRNKAELLNAEIRRAINWGAHGGDPAGADSEERYRTLFDNNPLETITVDNEGRITEYNLAKKKAGDRLPEIGTIMYKDYAAHHSINMYAEMMTCIRAGQPKEFTALPYREKILQVRISPFSDGAIITSINMTHLKQAETKLAHFATAVEQAQEEVVIINLDGNIEYANEAFLARNNLNLKAVIGKNAFGNEIERDVGLYDKIYYEEIWDTLKRGDSWTGYFSRSDPDAQHEVASTISPVKDTIGRVICYVSVSRDLTREAQLEESLQHARQTQLIGSIASGIAHDFNNLLSAIMINAELLSINAADENEVKASAEQIRLAGQKARTLISHILLFSRNEASTKEPLQLPLVVKEALKILGATLPANIQIAQHIPDDTGFIMGNLPQLQEMVMTLCDNAITAMKHGGGTLTVSISPMRVTPGADTRGLPPGNYLKLSVQDTGHGITPDNHQHIFEPFVTLWPSGKKAGLGLFVTSGIVSNHNGIITVNSEVGQGTEVVVFFPEAMSGHSTALPRTGGPIPHGNEMLLLVDDEPQITRTGKKILEKLGYTVITANSGEDALALLEEDPSRFDLMITDMTMPGITGMDLARDVTRLRPGLPIVLCTGYNQMVTPEKARALGIKKFIMKPFTIEKMAHGVRAALEIN